MASCWTLFSFFLSFCIMHPVFATACYLQNFSNEWYIYYSIPKSLLPLIFFCINCYYRLPFVLFNKEHHTFCWDLFHVRGDTNGDIPSMRPIRSIFGLFIYNKKPNLRWNSFSHLRHHDMGKREKACRKRTSHKSIKQRVVLMKISPLSG